MRIAGNTPLSELYHSNEIETTQDDELKHWKYIKREKQGDGWKYWYKDKNNPNTNPAATANTSGNSGIWKYLKREKVNGKWKYTYDSNAAKNNSKEKLNKATDNVLAKTNSAAKGLNKLVDNAKQAINKFYDDPNNMYDLNSSSYADKMTKIKETKEWKDIVARSDPEYVKNNADGTTTYMIDEYAVKKKHPLLDIASDIVSGRKVDINDITRESAVAGLKDYAIGTLRTGMLGVGVVSKVLTEKFKLQQGTYDDKIADLTGTVNEGYKYVDATMSTAKTGIDRISTATNTVPDVSAEDIAKLTAAISAGKIAAEATRSIDEGNVVKAAQLIMESDYVRSTVGNNEYYQMAESVLTNITDEEAAALALLLRELRS